MPTEKNPQNVTGWVGWVFFASIIMMLEGGFQIIDGLVAIFNKAFFVSNGSHVVVFNITAWGWINLALGIITVLAGMALLKGSMWARIFAIILASLSFFANMAFLPSYPIWSVIAMVIDVLVIYAVAVHGNELSA